MNNGVDTPDWFFCGVEIEKTISLSQLDSLRKTAEVKALKEVGKCRFSLTQQLFDDDFPGHYCRKIKSISIGIPAVVGPYQNVHATLTQTGNRVLLKPDKNGVVSGMSDGAYGADTSNTRSDFSRRRIAISKGLDDSGLFRLDFGGERYRPFEGTGAVSDWEFEMPKGPNELVLESVTDVIIILRYTALDGGEAFRNEVMKLRTGQASDT